MALVKSAKGSKILVKLGDGNSPEEFTHYCTINAEREFAVEANVNETVGVDCDDIDAAGWVEREVASKSGTITGQGMMNTPDYPIFWEFFDESTARNCQVVLDVDAADGGSIIEGRFLLTQLSMSGNRGEKMQGSITLQSDGPLVLVPNED